MHGIGKQQAEAKMYQAIIVIAGVVKLVLEPFAKRVFGVLVMAAKYMQQ